MSTSLTKLALIALALAIGVTAAIPTSADYLNRPESQFVEATEPSEKVIADCGKVCKAALRQYDYYLRMFTMTFSEVTGMSQQACLSACEQRLSQNSELVEAAAGSVPPAETEHAAGGGDGAAAVAQAGGQPAAGR